MSEVVRLHENVFLRQMTKRGYFQPYFVVTNCHCLSTPVSTFAIAVIYRHSLMATHDLRFLAFDCPYPLRPRLRCTKKTTTASGFSSRRTGCLIFSNAVVTIAESQVASISQTTPDPSISQTTPDPSTSQQQSQNRRKSTFGVAALQKLKRGLPSRCSGERHKVWCFLLLCARAC